MPRGTAGSVRVGNGAVFQGAGRIGGDFTASPQATTAIAIGEPLQVQGQANLAGTLHLLAPAPGYPVGSSERLMGYRSHTGAFSAVTYGSGFFYTAQLDYGSNSLDARLERTSAASTASALGAPQAVVDGARMADGLLDHTAGLQPGGGNDALIDLVGKLARVPTPAEAEASLASLAAEVHGTARAVAVQQAVAATQRLADRVALLEPEAAGFWGSATAQAGAFERPGFADADWHATGLTAGVDHAFGPRRPAPRSTAGAAVPTWTRSAAASMPIPPAWTCTRAWPPKAATCPPAWATSAPRWIPAARYSSATRPWPCPAATPIPPSARAWRPGARSMPA